MCRWAAYIGPSIRIEEIVCAPRQSLVAQSLHAREAKSETNGDGFGLAWYGDLDEPGLYREVLPAWSDCNLRSIARQVSSRLFMAHVRASTGGATSRDNCHPFVCGRWSFMHNGQIGGYHGFRRQADMMLSDARYAHRRGATDSEAIFLLALDEGLEDDPCGALARATGRFEALSRAHGAAPHVRMTVALSDGARLFCARYASDDHPPTLYHRRSRRFGGRALVSEPLDLDEGDWEAVPPSTFAEVTPEGVTLSPFRPCA
ncbi:MAG: class II glutamine amidotransferase [Rhodobacterales bacterium]|nr:class II glutamine amidotransferase [Rhodobacterales bacterium]